ncbi:C40 family peptidase [Streptomyces sp. CB03238]|uniref:C40 family peptidase n=1 Tax=Streptomyces sp. CB03238 TaxID=1907777 RepID=UPI000A11E8F1|nr:C40 family peptidase [Streptomyces sp. CB03238]ORT59763.1 glycoside hydrolase [Streptomyces sp. CB03238]
MSHTAHIPSHRKPRRSASKLSLRAGVAGGVLSTIAVAGAAGPANAEPVTETIEMPTLNADLSADLSSAVAASAEATQQVALDEELQAQEDAAAAKAAKEAKKAKAEAERKAEAEEARRKAEAKAEAAERASRSSERTTLSASVGSSDDNDGGGSSYDSSQATGSAAAIVAFARAQVGDAYVMGSTGPNSWDCSGLVQAAYRQAGIELPRVSGDQSSRGTSVSLDNLQPGDILYWGSRSNSYHVAIYVGGGMFVGAQNPSTGVVERSLDYDMPSGAVRVL